MIAMMIRQQIATVLGLEHSRSVFDQRLREIASTQSQTLSQAEIDEFANVAETYVRDTVDLLEACDIASKQAGVAHIVGPMLNQAAQYFLAPEDFIPDSAGLYGLLDDAYLSRSFVAHISDQYRQHTGVPLLPVDLHRDNLVIRAIIGEPVASQLDHAVVNAMQQAIMQQNMAGLYAQGTPLNLGGGSRTGGPGSWGGSVEDEIARLSAECGISI